MTDPITRTQLENMALDSVTLDSFVNAVAGNVTPRVGAAYKNVRQLIADFVATDFSPLYETEALGRAAVANGEYFRVVDVSNDEAIGIYLRVDASNSTLITTQPSLEALDTAVALVGVEALADESGYADVTYSLGTDGVTRYLLMGYSLAERQYIGHIAAKTLRDSVPLETEDYLISQKIDSNGKYQIYSDAIATGVRTALTSSGSNHNIQLTEDKTGVFYYNSDEDAAMHVAIENGTPKRVFPKDQFWCIGDSLTAGAGTTFAWFWPTQLKNLIGKSWSPVNGGFNTQRSDNIASRVGAVTTAITVTGDEIPASGTVSVTAITVGGAQADKGSRTFPTQTGPLAFKASGTLSGTVLGQACTLTTDASNNYLIAQVGASDPLACPAGTLFIPDNTTKDDFIFIIWAGTNNYAEPLQVVADVVAIYNYQKAFCKRVLVLGPLVSRISNSGTLTTLQTLRTALATEFGDDYIDVHEMLRGVNDYDGTPYDSAFTLTGLSPTGTDTSDIAAGNMPDSLVHTDDLHLNQYGYEAVAKTVYNKVVEKGWTL